MVVFECILLFLLCGSYCCWGGFVGYSFCPFGSSSWLCFIFFRRSGIRGYRFGPCCSPYFFRLSIYYLLGSSMPWRVKVYDTPQFPNGLTHLITSADKHQCHCANYTRDTSSWQTVCQYDIQSLFGADFIGWYIVYTRSQVGTLCESSTSRNVYGYVKYTFAPKMDTDVVV